MLFPGSKMRYRGETESEGKKETQRERETENLKAMLKYYTEFKHKVL